VVYEPGELKVIAYRNGKQWATDTVTTAGAPARLALSADRSSIQNDGLDLSFIAVRVLDKAGVAVPRADARIKFTIDGPGEIVATDNGDPTSFEPFQAHERKAFNGLALVIVRAKPGQAGAVRVLAESGSLEGASLTLRSVRHP
jgi:beta-galactosidase